MLILADVKKREKRSSSTVEVLIYTTHTEPLNRCTSFLWCRPLHRSRRERRSWSSFIGNTCELGKVHIIERNEKYSLKRTNYLSRGQ